MSTSYVSAAFRIFVTTAEAELVEACLYAADLLSNEFEANNNHDHYRDLGAGFAKAFPLNPDTPDSPFDSFVDLFDDRNYPEFRCDGQADDEIDGTIGYYFGGDNVDVDALAKMLQKTCLSALPFGFAWAYHSDKLRAGDFGGGYVVIDAEGVAGSTTSELIERSIASYADPGANGFVLTTADIVPEEAFWSQSGRKFGHLHQATVLSPLEAKRFDLIGETANLVPVALPPPLRF